MSSEYYSMSRVVGHGELSDLYVGSGRDEIDLVLRSSCVLVHDTSMRRLTLVRIRRTTALTTISLGFTTVLLFVYILMLPLIRGVMPDVRLLYLPSRFNND